MWLLAVNEFRSGPGDALHPKWSKLSITIELLRYINVLEPLYVGVYVDERLKSCVCWWTSSQWVSWCPWCFCRAILCCLDIWTLHKLRMLMNMIPVIVMVYLGEGKSWHLSISATCSGILVPLGQPSLRVVCKSWDKTFILGLTGRCVLAQDTLVLLPMMYINAVGIIHHISYFYIHFLKCSWTFLRRVWDNNWISWVPLSHPTLRDVCKSWEQTFILCLTSWCVLA